MDCADVDTSLRVDVARLIRVNEIRKGHDRIGQDRTGQRGKTKDRTGQKRKGKQRTGQDRTEQKQNILEIHRKEQIREEE